MMNVSLLKTRQCIDELKEAGHTTICLNFEERMPFSFAEQKKRKEIALFHDECRFLDKSRPESIGFDHLITISPMLLCNMPPDSGERILQAIADLPQKQ